MPIGTRPTQTFKVTLESDKDADPKPWFEFRFLTANAHMDLMAKVQKLRESDSTEDAYKMSLEIVGENMTDWGNMGTDFDTSQLGDLVSMDELQELMIKFQNQGINHDTVKN